MLGAGLIHKRKEYITHTTLHHSRSAVKTFAGWQKTIIFAVLIVFGMGLIIDIKFTVIAFLAILSFIYFLDIFFNLAKKSPET
jgi:hypothetical protein